MNDNKIRNNKLKISQENIENKIKNDIYDLDNENNLNEISKSLYDIKKYYSPLNNIKENLFENKSNNILLK